MSLRIKDATILQSLSSGNMLAVGNVTGDTDAACTLGQLKDFIESDLAEVALTGYYEDLVNAPDMNLYATLSTLNTDYYNRSQTNTLIKEMNGVSFKVVSSLPLKGVGGVIYLVLDSNKTAQKSVNIYNEYVWLSDGSRFEMIGDTSADFSDYYDKDEVDSLIPTVNNPTITITQGGVTKGSFTLNQSANGTISLDGTTSQVQSDWEEDDINDPSYIQNKPSIPTVNNTTVTLTQGGVTKGVITLNQSYASTIDFDSVSNVQSDWDEGDNTAPSYIQNKPVIPTVNNPTITFKQGNMVKGSITLNQSANGTIEFDDSVGGSQADWDESDTTSPAYIQNKPTIPSAQVQSDWNQSDNTAVDYIKNKPTVPSNTKSLLVTYEDGTSETIVFYIQ